MRFMVMIKSTPQTESMPESGSTEMFESMGRYNEELVNAGVMLSGEGLHPSSKGARVTFSGGTTSVVDGPFAEAKELVAGFWIWEVSSLDEAVEWVQRCPTDPNQESTIEIRQVFADEDFGAEFTPELREQEARMRAKITEQHSTV